MSNTKTLSPSILAMYLGCEVQFGVVPEIFTGLLLGVNIQDSGRVLIDAPTERIRHGMPINCPIATVRPILRPLSSMTEEECTSIGWAYRDPFGDIVEHRAEMLDPQHFVYLLSKHFDLFQLIENNLAVDKTTLK